MAINKIKKVEIIGLQQDCEGLLALLQKMALVDIQSSSPDTAPRQIPVADADILEIEEAVSYFGSFKQPQGFLGGIVTFKPLVYEEQLKDIISNFDYQKLLKDLSALRNHIQSLSHHRDRLIQEGRILGPWQNLKVSLCEVRSTQDCGVLLGILRTGDYENLIEDLRQESQSLFCEIVNQNRTNIYLSVIYLNESFERLEVILKKHRFNFITLGHHEGTAKQRLLEINRDVMILDDQIEDAKGEVGRSADERLKLMVVHDYLSGINRIGEADKTVAKQRSTFLLSGWIREKDVRLLENAISPKFSDIAIFISSPKDEEVPIDLDNNAIVQPFEFITKIYGLPNYNEIDPTPYLAPFFFLYFGFCVSDVGYGLMLVLLSLFALKRFRLGPQGLRFFKLFLFCGVSTIIAGTLTGSWFGNLIDMAVQQNNAFLPLKRFKDSLILLDPMKEPTKLLGLALCFGIIQVWFGHIVAAIINIKNRRYLNILLDQVTMFVFLFGLTGLGLIFLKLLDGKNVGLFKYASLIGSAGILLTQGRSEKTIGSKLFFGAFTLYSAVSGYLSDILSYSRLWALGLVTGVMANTINLISVEFSRIIVSIIPLVNKIGFIKMVISGALLVVIFSLGHTVSFFMNLLGAFVHPVRLQFVEFFSKFFKGGGNPFKPFKVESKYVDMGRDRPFSRGTRI